MPKVIDKILRAGEGKILRQLAAISKQVNALEDEFRAMSEDELRGMTAEFRERLDQGETLDDLMPEAFATVREAASRVLGQRHFDVQVQGGAALHLGNIAEMKTGEGKTLVATLPSYLNALSGKGVHVITVNDYLARYHAEWMGRVYTYLGLSVGMILPNMTPPERRDAYACDITYGTNNEFGFDYLRDNMADDIAACVQRGHNFAIVDEVDSILIDEARTPLIISGPTEDEVKWYGEFARIVGAMSIDTHYEVDEKKRTVSVTEEGIDKVEDQLGIDNLYDAVNTPLISFLNNAIKAKELFKRDKDYVVIDGNVIIVDEHTGRILDGRRYNEGLHQAIEAKEGVRIREEYQTLATVTLQNFFRLYDKLSGMTGTAMTEASEFDKIYQLGVVPIPTNRPMVRVDQPDLVYRTEEAKFDAVVADIEERHATGQPILVGTTSVEKSERLSKLLKKRGIPHEVLNAKQHEREAAIVAVAGHRGAVTVATNMAGRGTDIMLGGNVEFLADAELRKQGLEPTGETAEAYDEAWPATLEKVKAQVKAGGRGKAGGVKIAKTADEAYEHASNILGMEIKGLTVNRVLVTPATPPQEEYYFSFLLDRSNRSYLCIASVEGGVEIEEVAKTNPEAVRQIAIDPGTGVDEAKAREIAADAKFPEAVFDQAVAMIQSLYKVFVEEDATLVEVNPLARLEGDKLEALDGKVSLDDNASEVRHPHHEEFEIREEADPLEAKAKDLGLNYVKLDGEVGIIGNGAGLVMSTLDVVAYAGEAHGGVKPANFLDIGGGASAQVMADGLDVILGDPQVKSVFVNVFGGITSCDAVANGIKGALELLGDNATKPLVVRLDGNNVDEGRAILNELDHPLVTQVDTMDGAADKAAELANG